MDSKSPQVALLSIHPRFADAILSGTKQVEFRRRGFGRDVGVVVIYATKPVGKVVGWFEVEGIEHCHPDELWARFEDCGGIGRDEFDEYYRDRSEGVGIRVRTASRLVKPLELSRATDLATPPQCFAYLASKTAKRLLANRAVRLGREANN